MSTNASCGQDLLRYHLAAALTRIRYLEAELARLRRAVPLAVCPYCGAELGTRAEALQKERDAAECAHHAATGE